MFGYLLSSYDIDGEAFNIIHKRRRSACLPVGATHDMNDELRVTYQLSEAFEMNVLVFRFKAIELLRGYLKPIPNVFGVGEFHAITNTDKNVRAVL